MSFSIDDTLGYSLNRCVILLRINLVQKFKEKGYHITPEEWVILNRLWEKEAKSQNELAQTTIKDKTTVTRHLNSMEKKNLIIRKSSKEDARVKLIYLTKKGKSLKNILIPIAKDLLAECSLDIKKEEINTTMSVLKKIEQNLLNLEEN